MKRMNVNAVLRNTDFMVLFSLQMFNCISSCVLECSDHYCTYFVSGNIGRGISLYCFCFKALAVVLFTVCNPQFCPFKRVFVQIFMETDKMCLRVHIFHYQSHIYSAEEPQYSTSVTVGNVQGERKKVAPLRLLLIF